MYFHVKALANLLKKCVDTKKKLKNNNHNVKLLFKTR